MVDYIETFDIPGLPTIGVEDYTQPGDHFMPFLPHKQFKIWLGGSGGWECDTINDARKLIHDTVCVRLDLKIKQLQRELEQAQTTRAALGDDVFNLGLFLKMG